MTTTTKAQTTDIFWTCCPTCPSPIIRTNGETREAIITLDGAKVGAAHTCR